MTKYFYKNLNESQKDIIVCVLDKYCVPREIKINYIADPLNILCFYNRELILYDIQLDLKPDALEFVKNKIEETLKLENCFNKPSFKSKYNREQKSNKRNNKKVKEYNKKLNKLLYFDKLSTDVKALLLAVYPMDLLRSKKCKIFKTNTGYRVEFGNSVGIFTEETW